jgi:hypothetical protein
VKRRDLRKKRKRKKSAAVTEFDKALASLRKKRRWAEKKRKKHDAGIPD